MMVRSNDLKSPISTRLLPVIQMSSSRVLSEITKVLQSNENIPLDQSFTIDIVAARHPTGSGNENSSSFKVLDFNTDCLVKKSNITIRNKDSLCCSRAIVLGQAIRDKDPKLSQFKAGRLIRKKSSTRIASESECFNWCLRTP